MGGLPLEGCDLRLNRAQEHLATLDAERSAFLDQEDRRVVGHFESDPSEYVFRVLVDLPYTELGVIASEFAHHLRATLDNLLWELILLRGGVPTRANQFPIYESRERYQRRRDILTRGISADDRAIIEMAQPYNATPEAPDRNPLARVAWLNNTDKHRFLHACCIAIPPSRVPADMLRGPDGEIAERGELVIREEDFEAVSELLSWWPVPVRDIAEVGGIAFGSETSHDDPAELLRVGVTPSGPDPQMKVKDDLAVDIALSDGTKSIPIHDLSILYNAVETVVEWFRPRFEI